MPNGKELDKELLAAKIDNYLEQLAINAAELGASPRLRTPYPAQDIDGFFRLVGRAISAQQEAEGVQNPIIYTEEMPENDDNISSEIITYSVNMRKPGAAEQMGQGSIMGDLGFWPLVHLALVIYAAIQIFGSSADTMKKIIWIVIVAVFPLVGLIVWFFIGPGTPKK